MLTASNHDYTPAGTLLSLANSLPDPESPLAREARRLARKLAKAARNHPLQRRAADLTAALLTEADAGLALEADGLLDGGFDD